MPDPIGDATAVNLARNCEDAAVLVRDNALVAQILRTAAAHLRRLSDTIAEITVQVPKGAAPLSSPNVFSRTSYDQLVKAARHLHGLPTDGVTESDLLNIATKLKLGLLDRPVRDLIDGTGDRAKTEVDRFVYEFSGDRTFQSYVKDELATDFATALAVSIRRSRNSQLPETNVDDWREVVGTEAYKREDVPGHWSTSVHVRAYDAGMQDMRNWLALKVGPANSAALLAYEFPPQPLWLSTMRFAPLPINDSEIQKIAADYSSRNHTTDYQPTWYGHSVVGAIKEALTRSGIAVDALRWRHTFPDMYKACSSSSGEVTFGATVVMPEEVHPSRCTKEEWLAQLDKEIEEGANGKAN